jgi:hypothetical protein
MKLLLTTDLHYRIPWFRWLIEQAPSYDLVCIAGDLLDMFKAETRLEQAREITRLVRELADIVPVAICSGNHDNAGRLVSHDRASVYQWFVDLGSHPKIITDGSTRKLENLIVTTIPYHCPKEEKSIWLDRGSTIRRQTGMPWIVLHHVPPKKCPGHLPGKTASLRTLQTLMRWERLSSTPCELARIISNVFLRFIGVITVRPIPIADWHLGGKCVSSHSDYRRSVLSYGVSQIACC